MQQIGKGIRDAHHAEFPVAPLADELLRTLTAKYDVNGAIEKLKSTMYANLSHTPFDRSQLHPVQRNFSDDF